jgi:hypothetical protein
MIYIEAPKDIQIPPGSVSVFLAGGITNCPDHQSEICGKLKALPDDLIVFNPRRANFPMQDPFQAEFQIRWEFSALRRASIISFWFPKETLCPIVLLELGSHLMTNKPLIVGIHPDYVRRQDVEIQTSLARSNVPIVYSIDEVVKGIIYLYGRRAFNE